MYRYQLHTHSSPASHCSKTAPEDFAQAILEGGYTGCVLTNHFLHGNTGIESFISWQAFVEEYCEDYYRMKNVGDKLGIDVLFGVEEEVSKGLEVLCYGITPEILLAHPELENNDCKLWHDILGESGVLCIQAHPFRRRGSIPNPGPLPLDCIDGIEVFNSGNTAEDNASALAFAAAHPELILTSGADAHGVASCCIGGIETEERITCEAVLAGILRHGTYTLL